ncbi:Type I-E CRISPR-associated protein Cas5/CasD [Mycobacterium canetti]|uniref:type I-E CRISPR-associated protein Cas5/CasD n=1 Tax=Mycobacterium canetti TaxID=78331 RepID=UPI002D77CD69|nr:type I-E CRISPR-associated protein Cas5/CasD [Mycobacterium canetti]WRO42896.1 Type I-E CRISPR-associated protein Cas5/CasD [Mycobacterium canetti]
MPSDHPLAAHPTVNTLVLRLAGPLQSWGLTGQFTRRDTHTQPTKSGVVGMIAACLGRERGADISDLAGLRMGVRVDQPGILLEDYHTISRTDGSTLPTASGKKKADLTAISHRWYLADAVFLVTLTGDRKLLDVVADAIDHPVYAPTLGRRSCAPTGRLNLGVDGRDPETLLKEWPWEAGAVQLNKHSASPVLDATIEDPHGDAVIPDVPTSFAPVQRGCGNRRVRHFTVAPRHPYPGAVAPELSSEGTRIEHDPMTALEED